MLGPASIQPSYVGQARPDVRNFIPQSATARGTRGKVEAGAVLTPGRLLEWSLVYDPSANGGQGEIRVTLGKDSVTLALKPGQKAEGAQFDRVGLFTSTVGGRW